MPDLPIKNILLFQYQYRRDSVLFYTVFHMVKMFKKFKDSILVIDADLHFYLSTIIMQ